jgi:hypothetical protein
MKLSILSPAIFLVLLQANLLGEQQPARPSTEPELISVAPLGGRQGTTFRVEVRGRALEGVSGAWFQCNDLKATLRTVEKSEQAPKAKDSIEEPYGATPDSKHDYRAVLDVEAGRDAAIGLHAFRLVTPRGVSNALTLQVVSEPVVSETSASHKTPGEAQFLQLPTVVNGRINQEGELDFYSFDATEGQELLFQVLSNFKMDVSYRAQVDLTLYELSGSWFDPHRANPLTISKPLLSWEPVSRFSRKDFGAKFVLFPHLSHRFSKKGRYLISVGSFLGRGGPDYSYQLRIVSSNQPSVFRSTRWTAGEPAHPDPGDWLERDSATLRQIGSFTRRLEANRLQDLWARTAGAPRKSETRGEPGNRSGSDSPGGARGKTVATSSAPASSEAALASFPVTLVPRRESEPNDQPGQALQITVPTLVEGTIQQPGDVDHFVFNATASQALAFEIETPDVAPPRFNPWVKVLDAKGQELFANIYKEYGGDGDDVNKTLERKTLYTFSQEGRYILQVRDLTYRQGGAGFAYRILVRPQIPHLGRTEVSLGVTAQSSQLVDTTDRLNLVVGESRKFTVVCEKEEGFDGVIAIAVENLPPGVEALPSSPAEWEEVLLRGMQYRPLGIDIVDSANYRAKRQVVTVALLASPDAKPMTQPTLLRLSARPIVAGHPGVPLPVGEIPFFLVRPDAITSHAQTEGQ